MPTEIGFFEGHIRIERDYASFKKVLDGSEKQLPLQYETTNDRYTLFALDERIVYITEIFLAGQEPVNWSAGQITQNTSDRNDFLANWEPDSNLQSSPPRTATVSVNFRKANVAGTTFYMFIDLDNQAGAGPYKHVYQSNFGVHLSGVHGIILKSNISDRWRVFLGAILSINATQATIGWVKHGTFGNNDTGQLVASEQIVTFPLETDLNVSGGDYIFLATGHKEVVTAVNTATTLEDVAGNLITPTVGDVILKFERASGADTALLNYMAWYRVSI